MSNEVFPRDFCFSQEFLVFFLISTPQNHRGLKSSKSVLGREAKSLKNGIPTLCKGLQSNQSASPCRPPKQTNKQWTRLLHNFHKNCTRVSQGLQNWKH